MEYAVADIQDLRDAHLIQLIGKGPKLFFSSRSHLVPYLGVLDRRHIKGWLRRRTLKPANLRDLHDHNTMEKEKGRLPSFRKF